MQAPRVSIIIPALDEAHTLPALLGDLAALGDVVEIIVSDGGSTDETTKLVRELGVRVLDSPRGRAVQMHAGAAFCLAPVLLFLHADSRIPRETLQRIASLSSADGWGFFRPRLVGRSRWLPVVSLCMALRSRWTSIATGDQGLYVSRTLYEEVGGFPEQPLMEDIEICARLRRCRPPFPLREALLSSGRRWDRDGAWRTILLMWELRLRYFLGADPATLHRIYHGS